MAAKLKPFSLVAAVFVIVGCHFSEVAPNSEAGDWVVQECLRKTTSFELVVDCVAPLEALDEKDDQLVKTSSENITLTSESGAENAEFQCTTEDYEGVRSPEEQVVLDPTADTVYPGALIQGQSIASGHLSPIPMPRSAGTVVVSNISFDDTSAIIDTVDDVDGIDCNFDGDTDNPTYSCDMETVSLTNASNAMWALLHQNDSNVAAANIFYSIHEIHSESHLYLSLGLSGGKSGGGKGMSQATDRVNKKSASIEAEIEIDSTESTTVLEYKQVYYTMSFEKPQTVRGFFEDGTDVEEFKKYLAYQNPPGYVSSVSYGRSVYFFGFSKEDHIRVKVALEAAMQTPKVGGEIAVEGEYEKTLRETSMVAVVLGGNPDDAAKAITSEDMVEGLNNYIQHGAEYSKESPGVPIGYRIRWLANNEPARTSLVSEYSLRICEPIDPSLRVGTFETAGAELDLPRADQTSTVVFSSTGNSFLHVFGGRDDPADETADIILRQIEIFSIESSDGNLSSISADLTDNSTYLYEHEFVSNNTPPATFPGVWVAADIANDYIHSWGQAAVYHNGRYYSTGGNNSGASERIYTIDFDNDGLPEEPGGAGEIGLLDIADGTHDLMQAVYSHEMVVYDGALYIIGGKNGAGVIQSTVYRSELGEDETYFGELQSEFTAVGNLNTARANFGTYIFGNKLVVVGGEIDSNPPMATTIEVATFQSDGSLSSFSSRTPFRPDGMPYSHFVLQKVDNHVYLFGGLTDGVVGANSNGVYFAEINSDGSLGDWTKNSFSMTQSRYSASIEYSRRKFYLIGGFTGDNSTTSTIEMAPLWVSD